ncbi:hypothetical protein C7999DRAFT_27205 [Corynascus novoguineensis]|uniref:PAS domain-containing protein n=1 Tax=Corynascus novoguineensis TaxID=1126955 RepID=A0AAN7HVN1_9PEZI|nr:hypothetical protein C7999DRAFT_27205 [Corynascus novoguineensis]
MAAEMNSWEEQALKHAASKQLSDPPIQETLFYPGLYSPSGLDILTILVSVHTRPNPTIPLGAVDSSCALLISDLTRPDQPIVYVSQPFTALTGYTAREVLGRNCRFLQAPPPPPASSSRLLRQYQQQQQQQRQQQQRGRTMTITKSDKKRKTVTTPPPTLGRPCLDVPTDGQLSSSAGAGKEIRAESPSSSSTSTEEAMIKDRGAGKRRGYGVDMGVVREMSQAVEDGHEVQVEVINYKKSGEPFVNLVTIIPVKVSTNSENARVDADGNGAGAGNEDCEGCNFAVGFLCDVASLK